MKSFREAMELASAHLAAGTQSREPGEFYRAVEILDTVLETWPEQPEALTLLGLGAAELGKVGTSLALLGYACQLKPDLPEAHHNYGTSLRRAGHTEQAREAFRKALALRPHDGRTWGNIAGTYVNDGQPAEGVRAGRKALKLDPGDKNAENNLALCLLELGQWREGWKHYPARWHHRLAHARRYDAPQWEGQRVDRLLVHGEQGLGDEIMFLSCVPDLVARAAAVTIEVNARLVPLVRRSFPWAGVIAGPEELKGRVDAVVAMGDVPKFFRDGVPPRRAGYLKPAPGLLAKYADLFAGAKPVLLAFKGGVKATHEFLRNPPREAWKPLAELGNVHSIQYGEGAAERAAQIGVGHLQAAGDDLDEQLAAICAAHAHGGCLVSVQQTALHLAGASGSRVFGTIPSAPAWRYGLTGPMPWYSDNVRLFRQHRGEDWGPVVAQIVAAVEELRA